MLLTGCPSLRRMDSQLEEDMHRLEHTNLWTATHFCYKYFPISYVHVPSVALYATAQLASRPNWVPFSASTHYSQQKSQQVCTLAFFTGQLSGFPLRDFHSAHDLKIANSALVKTAAST